SAPNVEQPQKRPEREEDERLARTARDAAMEGAAFDFAVSCRGAGDACAGRRAARAGGALVSARRAGPRRNAPSVARACVARRAIGVRRAGRRDDALSVVADAILRTLRV